MNNPYKINTYRLLSMDEYLSNEQLILTKVNTFITSFNTYYKEEFIKLEVTSTLCKDLINKDSIIGFYNYDNLLVGLSVFTIDSPWYNPKMRVIEEIFSLSLYKGCGLINALSHALTTFGKINNCDIAVMANGSPLYGKLYSNSMRDSSWSRYNTYYKIL